jgi:hypothetical protein
MTTFNIFKTLIASMPHLPPIIAISETWFEKSNSKLSAHSIPGYSLIKISRDRIGGGVAIYVNKKIPYRELNHTNQEEINIVRLELQLNDKWIKFVAFYRPLHAHLDKFLKLIETDLDTNQPLIMCGDSNIDIFKETEHAQKFDSIIRSYGGFVANYIATRPISGTCIDQFITNNINSIKSCSTINTSLSDHKMLMLGIDTSKPIKKTQRIVNRFIDYDMLIDKFEIDIDLLKNLSDPNEQLDHIIHQIQSAVDQSTSKREFTIKCSQKIAPWYSQHILESMRHRQNLENKICKLKRARKPYTKLQKKLSVVDEKLHSLINDSAKQHYEKIFKSCDAKKAWRNINEILGNDIKERKTILIEQGRRICDEKEIASILNKHFASVSNAPTHINQLNFNKYNTIEHVDNDFQFAPVDAFDIGMAIHQLNVSKAPGHDGVSPRVIKKLHALLLLPLVILINTIFTTSTYPEHLKTAHVTGIFKESGEKTDKSNYRPISVLPVLSKVVDSIIKFQIEKFLKTNGVVDRNQLGFRKGSGADLAAIEFSHNIASALDKGNIVAAVFFDVSKAFDTIKHDVLLEKMEAYGFRGQVNEFVRSYLVGRKQAVVVNDMRSEYTEMLNGMAQGSKTGPQFFNLKVHDFKNLPLTCDSQRFADDIVCYKIFKIDEVATIESTLQRDIEIVQDYHEINGMQINPKKTKFMIFRAKDNKFKVPDHLNTLRGERIERVLCHRYLGGNFDENLNFEHHIKNICTRITPMINILSKLKYLLPTHILLNIYHAHIQSHINFMSILFGLSSEKAIDELQTLQNRALKHVFKLSPLHSTEDLYSNVATNILPVRGIAFLNALVFVQKVQKKRLPTLIGFDVVQKGLRNDGDLVPKKYNKRFLKRDISHFGAILYNNLSKQLKDCRSIFSFKKQARLALHSQLSKILKYSPNDFHKILKTT